MNKDQNTTTYTRAANRLIQQKRFQEVILKCTRAVSLDPNNASAYTDWANALFGLKCLDKAAIKLTRALQVSPDFARAYYNLGLLNYYLGNYEGAQNNLKSADRLRPYPQLLLYWGMSLQNQGNYKEATIKWETMIANSPKNLLPYLYCCMTLNCQGKYSGARLLYEKVLEIQQPMQTKSQILEFLNKDLTRTQEKFDATQDHQQKEHYHKKITSLLFYLNKIFSEKSE